MKFFLASLLLLCATTTALPQQLSITFTDPPQEQGLALSQRTCGPAGEVNGKAAWISAHNSVPGDEWLRAFNLRVKDDKFRAPNLAPVEIEVTFRHPGNTAVELWANTADGLQKIGVDWGNSGDWKTLVARVEKPRFNQTGDAPDIQIKAWAADFAVHRVTVRDLDPANPANWAKSVSIVRVTSDTNFIAAPGHNLRVEALIRNDVAQAVPGVLRWEVLNFRDTVLHKGEEKATLKASAETSVSCTLPLQKEASDPYRLRITMVVNDTPASVEEVLVAVATKEDAFILFNPAPVLHGLDFVRDNNQAGSMNVNGARIHFREANGAHFGGDQWWNSLLFNFTDPLFKNGNRPVADIRIFERHAPNAPIWLMADMQEGSRRIAAGWGNNPAWNIFYAKTDTARFNQTPSGIDPKELPSNGVDLRYATCSGPAQVRAIWVRGYDRDAPDYRRLIRFDGLNAGRGRFVFEPGKNHTLGFKITNLSRTTFDATCDVSLTDDLGNPLWSRTLNAVAPSDEPFELPIEFDARNLKQGVYRLAIRFNKKGETGAPYMTRTVNLMVSETSPLARARDGEFLYGVDPCLGYGDERFWQWADFMGADILRGFGCDQHNADQMKHATALHQKYNFRPYFFMDVAWHPDAAARDAENTRRAAVAAEQASRYDPQGRAFWELGNEPDLTFFYPGPVEAYAEGFSTISKAIKAATPSATVMNGGLCFAGDEGYRRAVRLVEIFPAADLDAWAFHGHGPGAQAERAAYERMYNTAKRFGKEKIAYAETESGFAASSLAQQRVQARTAIQKLVYAQSAGLKLFMWFRLLIDGGDADYSSLNGNIEEPRSVILAFRSTVKNLRHLTFRELLPLAPLKGECYFFSDAETPRRALVLWSDDTSVTRSFQLAGDARDAVLCDMFGNTTPLAITAGAVVIPLSPDPVFVTWQSSSPATPVVKNSPVNMPPAWVLTPGVNDALTIDLDNTTTAPLDAVLSVTAGGQSGVTVTTAPQPVNLAPGQRSTIRVSVTTLPQPPEIRWPRQWRAFFNLQKNLDPRDIKNVPEKIGAIAGLDVMATPEGLIDLAPVGGGVREHAPALLLAEITVAEPATINVGAAADWWMEWFVNGQPVYDTLENGNQGGRFRITDHVFSVALRKGKNLIAVRVLSGSQGWKFLSGGETELARINAADNPERLVTVVLHAPDKSLLAREATVVRWRQPILPATIPWRDTPPELDFYDDVDNLFVKQPDSSQWWRGHADLSAAAWFRVDAENIIAHLLVTDDTHRPPASAPASPDATRDDYAWLDLAGRSVAPQSITRLATQTLYTFSLPRTPTLDVHFLVIDNDWGELKQRLRSPVHHLYSVSPQH